MTTRSAAGARRAVPIVLVGLVLLGIAACGGGGGSGSDENDDPAAAAEIAALEAQVTTLRSQFALASGRITRPGARSGGLCTDPCATDSDGDGVGDCDDLCPCDPDIALSDGVGLMPPCAPRPLGVTRSLAR